MVEAHYPYYLANRAQQPNAKLEVTDKFTDEVVSRVALADKATLEQAIAAASEAAKPMRRLGAWQRKAVLKHLFDRCKQRSDELANAVVVEAGKSIQFARGEVARLVDTIELAAEESTRIVGEVLPLDISQRSAGYRGMWQRVP